MAGLTLRPAELADAPVLAELHVRSWQVAYRGIVPDRFLDGFDVPERTEAWRHRLRSHRGTRVATREDAIVGFVTSLAPSEVAALYVDPDAWRGGVGAALLTAAAGDLVTPFLWVLADNDRARRFYEARGWSPDGGRRTERIGGADLLELRYRPSP